MGKGRFHAGHSPTSVSRRCRGIHEPGRSQGPPGRHPEKPGQRIRATWQAGLRSMLWIGESIPQSPERPLGLGRNRRILPLLPSMDPWPVPVQADAASCSGQIGQHHTGAVVRSPVPMRIRRFCGGLAYPWRMHRVSAPQGIPVSFGRDGPESAQLPHHGGNCNPLCGHPFIPRES